MVQPDDKLIDHGYDGIQEYDNPLPQWWVFLFIFTIIWGGIYIIYYHLSDFGQSSSEEYALEVKDYKVKFASLISSEQSVNWNEPDFEKVTDNAKIEKAKLLFKQNCISCHGILGQGGIGPNLTDDYWIHGNGINNIARTIALGVPEKGMIPWKLSLKADDIIALASLVITMHGSNPPGAKAPQGVLEDRK